MTRDEYLERMRSRITPAQSRAIRTRLAAGEKCRDIADEVDCVPTQVAAVKANVTRGR